MAERHNSTEAAREAFEAWFAAQPQNEGQLPKRDPKGDYYYTRETDRMWEAWTASRLQALTDAEAKLQGMHTLQEDRQTAHNYYAVAASAIRSMKE